MDETYVFRVLVYIHWWRPVTFKWVNERNWSVRDTTNNKPILNRAIVGVHRQGKTKGVFSFVS